MKNTPTSRRHFLKTATAATATAFTIVAPHVVGCGGRTRPNDRIHLAVVGVGGRGEKNIQAVWKKSEVGIIALCDVDEKRAATAFKNIPDAAKYTDFRVMLEKEKSIDAVIVATPDHTHAVVALAAMELGKHVYVEKPLTRTIPEVRALMEAAQRYKVATQMGNQGHAFTACRVVYTMIHKGAIGEVREVHSWTDRPGGEFGWPQGIARPADTPSVPDSLDWDLWIGPSPERPYHPAYLPLRWRGWIDFGTGALGDMGCHIMDGPFWALNLGIPTRIEPESSGVNGETYPAWSVIRYSFPKRGKMPPVTLTWYDGGKMPPRPEGLPEELAKGDRGGGTLYVGEKGMILADRYSAVLWTQPASIMESYTKPMWSLKRSPGHHQEWLDACRGAKPAGSHFPYSGPLTEIMLLGNLALCTGEPIDWDAENMKATNVPNAEQYISPAYREGWTLG